MSGWRLVVDRGSYADFSISVSPAVEKAVARGESPPTVFLTVFDSDSITIGVNEDPEQVLDLAFCRAHGISFRRRVNGGGPIYAGADSCFLVYFLPLTHEAVPRTTAEAFPRLLGALAETFAERYRFPAEYRPLNDIQVEGRKLVPASLKIENGVMTLRLVINVKPIDTELAGRAMPMAPEKVRDKPLKDLTSRFTWLEREAGRTIDAGELAEFSIAATARAFGETGLVRGALSERERGYAASFRAELATEDWLHGKSERTRLAGLLQPGDTIGRGREKAVGGMIRATLAVGAGRVRAAIVNGDWHPRPIESVTWLEDALSGVEAAPGPLRAAVEGFLARGEVEFAGVAADDLMVALRKALDDQRPARGAPRPRDDSCPRGGHGQ